jgi:hypothetical protein
MGTNKLKNYFMHFPYSLYAMEMHFRPMYCVLCIYSEELQQTLKIIGFGLNDRQICIYCGYETIELQISVIHIRSLNYFPCFVFVSIM